MPNYLKTSKKKSHTYEFFKNMKWLHFKEIFKYKILCITRTAIYKQTPTYIATHNNKYSNNRSLRSTNNITLKCP